MARRKEPVIPDAILDQLLGGADAKTAFERGDHLREMSSIEVISPQCHTPAR